MTEPGETQGNENQENLNQEAQNTATETNETTEVIQAPVLKDEDFLALAKEKYGKDFTSVDEIFADRAPVEKIVNKWEGVIDEETEQWLTFKKETGRTRKEFEALNVDYSTVDPLQIARERARAESGQDLSNELADQWLAKKLSIDLTDPKDIDPLDLIDLRTYAKPLIDQKIADKEKYRQPITPKAAEIQPDMIQLENGSTMKKVDYEQLVATHQKHIADTKEAANSVTESSFKVVFDDDGTERVENFKYEYSPEDKHSMVSIASDVSATMEKRYRSEKGFNNHSFNEDMWWSDPANREKAIASIVHKAVAQNTEAITKAENNVNFERNDLQKQGAPSQITSFSQLFNRKN